MDASRNESQTHTPGPWEFGKDRRWLFRDNLKHDGKFSSSTVLKIDDDAFRPSDADAHLIAAAPKLLEALKGALGFIEQHYEPADDADHALIGEVRAAIAKAEGRA